MTFEGSADIYKNRTLAATKIMLCLSLSFFSRPYGVHVFLFKLKKMAHKINIIVAHDGQ